MQSNRLNLLIQACIFVVVITTVTFFPLSQPPVHSGITREREAELLVEFIAAALGNTRPSPELSRTPHVYDGPTLRTERTGLLAAAAPRPENEVPPHPELLELPLTQSQLGGISVLEDHSKVWTGNQLKIKPFWRARGFEGVHVINPSGNPDDVHVASSRYHSSIVIGRAAGYVKLEGLTIHTGTADGKQSAVFAGFDSANKPDLVPMTLHLVNCRIVVDGQPEWGIFVNQCDVVLERCVLELRGTNEHALYVHGVARFGVTILDCLVDGVGAEGFKVTGRPQARYYVDQSLVSGGVAKHALHDGYHPPLDPEARIIIRRSTVLDWNQPWSWRGGAGVCIQGAGMPVTIEDCVLVDHNGEVKGAAFFDDSGVEHFGWPEQDANGDGLRDAGVPDAVGPIIIRRSILASGPSPQPLIRVGRISPALGRVAPSILIEDCGLYGAGMRVELQDVGQVQIRGCNTAAIAARAEALDLGIDTTAAEPSIAIKGAPWVPVSVGFERL